MERRRAWKVGVVECKHPPHSIRTRFLIDKRGVGGVTVAQL